MADIRQSAAYAKYIKSIGWRVVRYQGLGAKCYVFIRPLGFLGAIAKIQRISKELGWKDLDKVLRKHRVWMTKLEPSTWHLAPSTFHQDGWPLLASKTQRVDLDDIRPKKDARYCLRKVQGSRFKVRENDFGGFYKLWKKAAGIKRLWIPPEKDYRALIKAFGKNVFCVTIDNLAGAVVLVHQKTAYYYYAACLPAGKLLYLPYLVVWECMKEARRRRCKVWDWEGIYDQRWPDKGWRGFTHFKKSFGGYEVEFPGSFTRWF